MPRAKRSAPVRRDPKRHIDPEMQFGNVAGRDPSRKYVLANPNDPDRGVDYYLSIGYVIEAPTDGGPRVVGGSKKDGTWTFRGQVLMSVDIERWTEIQEVGADGRTGLALADLLEQKIVKPGGVDGVRGMAGVFDVRNETSKAFAENG